VTGQAEKAERFLQLHQGPEILLMPNAWDAGSAKLLASLGFTALATTSSGFAATLGRLDGAVSLEEAIEHAKVLVAATDVPVSADLENGYADAPADVAATVRLAVGAGLAGCSIEDYTGDRDAPIYELALATERVAAAVEAAHGGDVHLVLTARAENLIRGRDDLDDTIARLVAYQDAGADVLFAPGVADLDTARRIVAAVERPVSVLLRPGGPTVAELAEAGVARISVGGAFAFVALGAVVEAAHELQEQGTTGYWSRGSVGVTAARAAFAPQ
jgi:2-methylisocitrate lyase-like PEP mutase family enzyme